MLLSSLDGGPVIKTALVRWIRDGRDPRDGRVGFEGLGYESGSLGKLKLVNDSRGEFSPCSKTAERRGTKLPACYYLDCLI